MSNTKNIDDIGQIMDILLEIIEDRNIPKNIRAVVEEVGGILKAGDSDFDIKKDKSIQLLDNVCEDPNLNMLTRTQIWNVVSTLESIE